MNAPEISELLGAIGVDAINIQLRLDQYFAAEMTRTEWLISRIAGRAGEGEWMRLLVPRRLRIDHTELTFRAGISVTTEEGLTIHALPLNAEFTLRTSTRLDRHSQISVSVEQIPVTKEQM